MMPWQMDLLDRIKGKKPGEITFMTTGRRMGKSMINSMMHQAIKDYINLPLERLDTAEGTVFGATYYIVEPIGGNWKDMEAWARQTYNDPADIWEAHNFMWPDCGRWYMNDRKFWFRDESDRTIFLMKWS
jgi:glycerol kinase